MQTGNQYKNMGSMFFVRLDQAEYPRRTVELWICPNCVVKFFF